MMERDVFSRGDGLLIFRGRAPKDILRYSNQTWALVGKSVACGGLTVRQFVWEINAYITEITRRTDSHQEVIDFCFHVSLCKACCVYVGSWD